jgi:hypothetical protein
MTEPESDPVIQRRIHRLGRTMESAQKVNPDYAMSRSTQRPHRSAWILVAAVAVIALCGALVVRAGSEKRGESVASSTRQPLPTGAGSAEPVTTSTPSDDLDVPHDPEGGTPTPAVNAVERILGGQLEAWYPASDDPESWSAKFQYPGTTEPAAQATFVTGPKPPADALRGGMTLGDLFLPGGRAEEVSVPNAEAAYRRIGIDRVDVAVVSNGHFFIVTVGNQFMLQDDVLNVAGELAATLYG